MAKFQEVGRQWARMCKAFRTLPNGCSGCPEEGKQCTDEEQLLILLMASVNTPIPAEIAQKLGIEPKEVR